MAQGWRDYYDVGGGFRPRWMPRDRPCRPSSAIRRGRSLRRLPRIEMVRREIPGVIRIGRIRRPRACRRMHRVGESWGVQVLALPLWRGLRASWGGQWWVLV